MLICISFVGVDGFINYSELTELKNSTHDLYKIEFGLLYSLNNAGVKNRYPELKFINDFSYTLFLCGIDTSLHLCGSEAIESFIYKKTSKNFISRFNRIQVNINAIEFAYKHSLSMDELYILLEDSINFYETTCVIQNKQQNTELVNLIKNKTHVNNKYNILYDSSGGTSKEISLIEEPLINFYTGYAGGINPKNVLEIVNKIDNVNRYNLPYYIDMESGIRTNDYFDLTKCQQIIGVLTNRREFKNEII